MTILFTGQASAAKEPIVGHAAFFYLNSSDHENAVYDDFSYYLNSINPWLAERNVVVSYHQKAPFEVSLASGQTLRFNANDFKIALGFVLVRPDGQIKTYYGVHTGVDIMHLTKEFLN